MIKMPPQLVSLHDMLKVYAKPFYEFGAYLEGVRTFAVTAREGGIPNFHLNPQQTIHLLQEMEVFCRHLGLRHTAALAAQTREQVQSGRETPAEIHAFLITIDRSFLEALTGEWFLRVDADLRQYYDQPVLFGPLVHAKFPSARPDIQEAGNCLATERNTAAVFHLMRAVEWALRAMCANLGFTRMRKTKKSGKVSYQPIEHTEWDKILKQLQARVDAKMVKLTRGAQKQKLQEFYYPAIQDVNGFREAWRNHVMHSRREYNGPDALAVLGHVQRFMVSASEHISEV
jgi:hypothetical protein